MKPLPLLITCTWIFTALPVKAIQEPEFLVRFQALVEGEPALQAVEWKLEGDQERLAVLEPRRWSFTRYMVPGKYQIQAKLKNQIRTTQFEVTRKQVEVRIHF